MTLTQFSFSQSSHAHYHGRTFTTSPCFFMAVKPHCPVICTQYRPSGCSPQSVTLSTRLPLTPSSMLLFVHRDSKDGEPSTATSTFTKLCALSEWPAAGFEFSVALHLQRPQLWTIRGRGAQHVHLVFH